MGLFKKLWNFVVDVFKSAVNTVKDFVEEVVDNAPAAAIMVAATASAVTWIKMLPLERIFLPVPFINETAVAGIAAVLIVLGLATLAGRNYVLEGGM